VKWVAAGRAAAAAAAAGPDWEGGAFKKQQLRMGLPRWGWMKLQ